MKNLKRKPLILTIAVILCAAAIVFGVFSQALYDFKIYEKVPVSMEKNGIDLCTVKYSEKGYSDYDAEDFSYFDGETLNAMKKLNADNELYSFANIGSRFFLIKGKRDIETLGFQLADYSEELTDDGVYIADTLAQERFLNNYYKLNKNGNGECITELKDLIGTIYPSKDFSDDNSVKIDGIIISGYADKNSEDALSNTIGDKKYNFYRERLEDNYFCTEKYFRQEGLNAIKIDKTFFIADKTVNGDVSFIQDNGDRLAFIIDGAGKVYLSDAFGTETFPELKADECVLPLSVYNELFGTEYLANDFYDVFNEESAPKKIPVTGQKLTIIINSGEREISRNVKVIEVSFIPTMDILNYQSYETLVSCDFISEITSKLDIKRSGVMIKINDYKQFADYMKTIDTGNHESAGYYVTAPYADELYNYEFSGLSYVRDIFFAMAIALTVIALFIFVFYLLNIINNDKKTLGILRSLGASRGSVTGIYIWQGIIISAIIAVISLAAAIPFIIYQNHSIAKQILKGATVLNLTFSLIAEVILLPFVVMAVAVVGAVSKILKSQPIDIIKIVK